jgi:hypothetical protein
MSYEKGRKDKRQRTKIKGQGSKTQNKISNSKTRTIKIRNQELEIRNSDTATHYIIFVGRILRKPFNNSLIFIGRFPAI